TRFSRDWSSDVCSSDLQITELYAQRRERFFKSLAFEFIARVVGCLEIFCTAKAIGLNMSIVQSLIISSGSSLFANLIFFFPMQRSEERRVGKEFRSWWW